MIRALLEHHAERARSGVAFNALADCHADGMDSIVLHDEPENRVRMFFADYHHAMYKNTPGEEFSVALHPHHCTIRLVELFGNVRNDVYGLTPHPAGDFAEMEYRSAIGGQGSMVRTGARAFASRLSHERIVGTVRMAAHSLHTIYVPRDTRAAWLVIEGAEDENYTSRCWTNCARDFNPAGMYRPMTSAEVAGRLDDVLAMTARSIA